MHVDRVKLPRYRASGPGQVLIAGGARGGPTQDRVLLFQHPVGDPALRLLSEDPPAGLEPLGERDGVEQRIGQDASVVHLPAPHMTAGDALGVILDSAADAGIGGHVLLLGATDAPGRRAYPIQR